MTTEQVLTDELKACFSDWDGDFDIDVEEEDGDDRYRYFSVVVTHRSIGDEYHFSARVGGNDSCEMDFHEDSWNSITMGNVFAFMWFETATQRAI